MILIQQFWILIDFALMQNKIGPFLFASYMAALKVGISDDAGYIYGADGWP